jgi:REP element-mobilizing transposase RayT
MTTRPSYARHLPHQLPEGFPIFLTWNLKGSLPRAVIQQLVHERQRLEKQGARPGETNAGRRIRESKIVFAMADRFLDQASDGPLHLKEPPAARIVEDSILFGAGDRYDLFAWCVMANHVHVLLTPHGELQKVTQRIKGYTAYQINRLQAARGRVFWQDESYDHWSRDEAEMLRIIHYIENNPVAAQLCQRPADWPWSSARFRENWTPGEAYGKERQAGQPDLRKGASGWTA